MIRSFEAKAYSSVGELTHFHLLTQPTNGYEDERQEVWNPFLDWIDFNKSFVKKVKDIATALKHCMDDFISKRSHTELLAFSADFYKKVSSKCAEYLETIQDHDDNDFSEGGYQVFSLIKRQAFKMHELRDYEHQFDSAEDFQIVLGIIDDLKDFMNKFVRDLEEHSVWIFMNFYRSYNPFFYRNSAGEYFVQDFKKFEESIHFRSLGLYFMVCNSMLVNRLTNI